MFDEITCEYPLPKTGYRIPFGHSGFQTKDLICFQERYTINMDGRLIHHDVKYEWIEDETGISEGYMKDVSETLVDTGYHGDISFYDKFLLASGDRVWIQFKARFTEGTVSWIRAEDIHEMPPAKRVEIGGREYPASEWVPGLDVVHLAEEVEIERDES